MWQGTLVLTVTVMLAGEIDIVVSQLPCDSPLRIFRPHLFTHCSSCLYGTWSEWKRINHLTHGGNCSSGYFYKVTRSRKDLNETCNDEMETDYHCK